MKANKGFSLLEVLGVLAITAILIGIAAGPTLTLIERARQDAEARTLDRMSVDIQSSFQSSDLNNINISALPGEILDPTWATTFTPAGLSTPTGFPAIQLDTDGFPVIGLPNPPAQNQWWFVKLARLRGMPLPDISAGNWSRAANPAIYDLITNVYYRPRLLVAEPQPGLFSQRYMLISIMAPIHRNLPIPDPTSDPTAYQNWFDNIWKSNPEQGLPPAGWDAAWSQNNNAQKLKIVRITQPRFQLTLNNTSKTDAGFIYFDGRTKENAGIAGTAFYSYYVNSSTPVVKLKIPALDNATGGWSTKGILGGRRIIITRGASPTTLGPTYTAVNSQSVANPVFDFNLNETTTITIQ